MFLVARGPQEKSYMRSWRSQWLAATPALRCELGARDLNGPLQQGWKKATCWTHGLQMSAWFCIKNQWEKSCIKSTSATVSSWNTWNWWIHLAKIANPNPEESVTLAVIAEKNNTYSTLRWPQDAKLKRDSFDLPGLPLFCHDERGQTKDSHEVNKKI